MSVIFRLNSSSILAAAILFGGLTSARADDAAAPKVTKLPSVEKEAKENDTAKKADQADSAAPAEETAVKKPKAAKPVRKVKQLSQDMAGRRDRVRKLLKALREQPFSTQQNNCADILDFCRGFGCDTELLDNAGTGQKVNGITCLCWNVPCNGNYMMTYSEGHLAPRIGYGYQSEPSELAAVLALSDVPADYPARVGRIQRTVADLIEYEKLTCRADTNMSLKLVALAHYVHEPSWKDSQGGDWTLKRMVTEELGRPAGAGDHDSTDRLLGLAAALRRFKADKVPLEGDLAQARSYIDESTAYAFSSQNSDGSWGRATNRDYSTAVAATAHMLEWLALDQPASGLEDMHMVQAIDFLTNAFMAQHYQAYISTMNAREISAAMHAAYVLNVYDQRVFAPADPLPEAAPEQNNKAEPKAAERVPETR